MSEIYVYDDMEKYLAYKNILKSIMIMIIELKRAK